MSIFLACPAFSPHTPSVSQVGWGLRATFSKIRFGLITSILGLFMVLSPNAHANSPRVESEASARVLSSRTEGGWAYIQFEVTVDDAPAIAKVRVEYTVHWTDDINQEREYNGGETVYVRGGRKTHSVKVALTQRSEKHAHIDSIDIDEVEVR